MIMSMIEQFLLRSLKHCKTFSQVHQTHAYGITTGVLSPRNCFLLSNILSTVAQLSAATNVTASSDVLNYALSVFNHINSPTSFSYNTMMRVQILLSSPASAICLFTQMRRVSIPPDFHTYPFAIKASGLLHAPLIAATLHSEILKFGFISDIYVLNSIVHVYAKLNCLSDASSLFACSDHKDVVSYNAMIDGFVKAGDFEQARALFDKMTIHDEVSWGTLIAGYARMNFCQEAIDLFNSLLHSSCSSSPDNVSLVSVLSACAKLGDLEQGREIHNYILQNKIRLDSFLSTGLVDFYAKSGCIEIAINIFESSSSKNLFTWNALLVGLAMNGQGKVCLEYFFRMMKDGIQPDGVSFLGVLVGCSHAGLVSEARKLFQDMEAMYGVRKELKHYGCMADLYGRAGLIREALQMIEQMPIQGDIYTWGGLLAGCRKHGIIDVAEDVAKHVKKLCPDDGGVYSVMVDMYANSDLWDNVLQTRHLIKTKRVKKNAACSLIKLNGTTHEFIAGDSLHPRTDDIHLVLSGIQNHQFGT
ncbi:pentatricopeptide repeat-containing protein At5g61800-like [Silene latifolia]|uniref:pentatricopeptide repeat-containing protein At5g61800-like n=1 Tax=Silene latifolia TaxID=37657 RepID=UPI003D776DD2